MSTRFSQWRNTEYVGLPVESYLQAGLVQDQRIESELQKTSAALAEYKSLQAVGANAEAYQNEIMSGIKGELEALAKENLKSPEALMKMQSIISNPTYVGGLKNIAKNTEYFKLAQKAAKDYEKESGNKINAAPFYKAYQELMTETGDPTKFNPNRFAGLDSVPKYMEIQKEIDDVVGKMKPGTKVWDYKKGIYDIVRTQEELTPDRIANAVKHEFGARKDIQAQLQRNIEYDSYSSGMSTEARGQSLRTAYSTAYDNLTKEVEAYKTNPAAFKAKYKLSSDDEAKQTLAAIENQRREYETFKGLDSTALLAEKSIRDSAVASASLFAYTKESMKKTVNPIDVLNTKLAWQDKKLAEMAKLADGNTATVDMGMEFAMNAPEVEKKIESSDFIRELVGSAGIDIRKYETPEQTAAREQFEKSNPKSNWELFAKQNKKGIFYSTGWGSGINDVKSPQVQKLVADVAAKYGYDPRLSSEKDPVEFLKSVYRKGNHMGVGVINSNFDSDRITKGIATGAGTVYVNGVAVTDASKQTYLNMLNNPTNDSKGINLAKSSTPIISVRLDGKPVANYRDPNTGDLISYELPGELARGMGELSGLMKAKSDPTYGLGKNKPITVTVPGVLTTKGQVPGTAERFTAARLNDGTNNLVMFKDADNPAVQVLGAGAVHKVAAAMADYDINLYNEADKVKLYNKAIQKINDLYQSNLVKDPEGRVSLGESPESKLLQVKNSKGLVTNVKLDKHLFIINRAIDKAEDIVNLHVGIGDPNVMMQNGKGFIKVGGMYSENHVGQQGLKKYGEALTNKDKYKAANAAIIGGGFGENLYLGSDVTDNEE